MLRITKIFILFFWAALLGCTKHHYVSKKEAQHQDLKNSSSLAKFDSIIAPYNAKLAGEMQKELVLCNNDLTKDGAETTLGNFVCDAMKWAFDSIIGLTSKTTVMINRGGLRSNIPKGMITVNSIFEVMPFDNELVFVIIKGSEMQDVIKKVVEKKHAFSGMFIKLKKSGDYIATIDSIQIDAYSNYNLLCSDFVVSGGDGFTFGTKLIHEKRLGITIRDAMINYCKHLRYTKKTLSAYKDGRFEISK